MKKRICIALLAFVLLAGCAPKDKPGAASGSGAASQGNKITVTLALPNDQADGFDEQTAELEKQDDMAAALVAALVEAQALPQGSEVNHAQVDGASGPKITLDMNKAFQDAVSSTGTAGETMMLGALINTLWSYYQPSEIVLTVDGAVLETGHNVYDMPFTEPFQLD